MAQTAPARRPRKSGLDRRVAAGNGVQPDGAGPRPDLRIVETRVLRGANYWAREPVIRMLVDLGSLEDYPSNLIPGFSDALVELLPTLEEHACSLGRRQVGLDCVGGVDDHRFAGHLVADQVGRAAEIVVYELLKDHFAADGTNGGR